MFGKLVCSVFCKSSSLSPLLGMVSCFFGNMFFLSIKFYKVASFREGLRFKEGQHVMRSPFVAMVYNGLYNYKTNDMFLWTILFEGFLGVLMHRSVAPMAPYIISAEENL